MKFSKAIVVVGILLAVSVIFTLLASDPSSNWRVASAQEASVPGFLEPGKAYTVRIAGVCTARMKVLQIESSGWVRAEGIEGCLLRDGDVGWWNANTGQAIIAE